MENEKSNSSRQIRLGAIISYLAIAFNIIAGLLYTPWMISKIGQSNYGLYTLATSLITMFMIDFGLSSAIARFISKYVAEGRQTEANGFLGLVYKLYLVIDIAIFVILLCIYFFIGRIYSQLSPEEISVFKVLYIIVSVHSILTFPFMPLNGVLISYEKYVPLKLCDLLYKLITIVLVVITLSIGGNVISFVAVTAFAGIVATAVKYGIVKKETPIKADLHFLDRKMLKEVFGFSVWTTITSVAQRLFYNIAPTIIAAVSITGATGVAIFGMGSTIEGYVYSIASAICGLFLPRVTRMVYGEKDQNSVMELSVRVGRIECYIIGLLIVGFASVGKSFIVDIWNKPDFAQSYYCTMLLILPSYFYLPMEIMNTTLVVKNKVKSQAIVFVISGVINAILSFVFSKIWGAIGAALSIFIACSIRTLIMVYVYRNDLQFDMKRFYKETYLKITPILIITTLFGWCIERFNPITNVYFRFVCNGLVVVSITVVLLWKFIMNDSEKSLLWKVFKVRG